MSTYYHTCPDCGANLDPEERCDCRKQLAFMPVDLAPKVKKYQKKPVYIEALRWNGTNHADVGKFLGKGNYYYDFDAVKGGLVILSCLPEGRAGWKDVYVRLGEYIIKCSGGVTALNAYDFDKQYVEVGDNG